MDISQIKSFIREVEQYQSNHYGYYDRRGLVISYINLPGEVKRYLSPSRVKLSKSWRGCDGLSETTAISFTTNREYASTFGMYVLPFVELKNYNGLIDTFKLLKLKDKLNIEGEIGDDEDEIIVLNPVWSPNINIYKYIIG